LAHYFGDRESLVAAILQNARKEGDIYLAMAAQPAGRLEESIHQLVGLLGQGLDRGVLSLQVIGLTEGLANPSSAQAYLGHHLEPVLQAIARRLASHQASGDMRQTNAHYAAIALLSPMVVVRLHQSELGGAVLYPLQLSAFDEEHAAAFVRAYSLVERGSI
jgi:AcrR family transcriptional regulator